MFFGIINTVHSIEINRMVQNTLIFSSILKNDMSYSVMQNVIFRSTVSIRLYFKIESLDKNDEK